MSKNGSDTEKSMRSIKAMILGIQIMLLGGLMIIDPSTRLGGIGYIIVLAGLFIGLFGYVLDN